MNSIKAITQLEELKRDRLSFIQNDDSDEIYLNDIKAITLSIEVTTMLVEDAIKSGFKVIVETITN